MNLERYLQLIAWIGYVGAPLEKLETRMMEEWGIAKNTAWDYVNRLIKEGLVKRKREVWKEGRRWRRKIWIVPTSKLKRILADMQESWDFVNLKRYKEH